MKKLWNQNNEAKALIVSTILTLIGFCGTVFLFWLKRYDIPLAVLVGGGITILSWLVLYLLKKTGKPHTKIEIAVMFSRLIVITSLAVIFAILAYHAFIVIFSPIAMIIAYFVVSLTSVIIFSRKGE